MPERSSLASQIVLKVDGTEVQPDVIERLSTVIVDQHTQLPHMFTIRLHDTNLDLLDHGPFNLTKEVEIKGQSADGQEVTLIKGEITALEPEFREGMVAELVVRGYDKLHRLYRETHSKAYLNAKDSDLATEIARAINLQAEVDSTTTVYEHIFQNNQADLVFLSERAWRIGFECFVDADKLYFRKPPENAQSVQLRWGDDLLSFRPRMTLSEQVDEVMVKGWDPSNQKAIVGKAENGRLYPSVQEQRNGASWANSFGKGKLIIVDLPVTTQEEANELAAARLNEISGAFLEAEGLALRRPDIRAGQAVQLEALGERFSGKYLVTSATHVFAPEGLRTQFRVSGVRTGLLAEQVKNQENMKRWPGAVIGIVTNTSDEEKLGRVKVKFPWMAEDVESNWARVMGVGAGSNAGFYAIPNVGDEVLVVFLHGDFQFPLVVGGLWSGQNKPPEETDDVGTDEKPQMRTWRSIKGHRITMNDASKKNIEIKTTDGRSIMLDDQNKKIIIKTDGITITIEDQNLKIEADGNINIKTSGNMTLESSGNMDIKAGGQMNIKGSMINLN